MGRVASQTNPFTAGGSPGPSTSYIYDALGRAILVTLPDAQTVQTIYSGATVTVTDQVNRKLKRESDGLGRLIKVTEQDVSTGLLTPETTYDYNLLDKLTSVNQGGQYRTYKFDALGRMLYERIPEQTATINDGTGTLWTTKYTYTDFSAVATKKDARGVVSTYSYDQLNRLTSVVYNISNAPGVAPGAGAGFTYDNNNSSQTNGLLLSAGNESYSYDGYRRVSSITRTIDSINYTTSYQYGAGSIRSQITYPSGRVVNINRSSTGRLTSLTDQYSANYLSGISYNPAGQVTGLTLGNGVTETYGYDPNRLQLTSQTATKSGGPTNGLMNLTYNYQATAGQMGAGSMAGNAGQLMSISGTINSTTESAAYTYDNLGRLATSNQTSNGSSAQRRFVYDRWGNRTGVWDSVSGGNLVQSILLQPPFMTTNNRILSVTSSGVTKNYTYDAAGNVINDGTHSYVYDGANRLVSMDSGAAQYSYDQNNRRYKKTVGSSVTHYVWEGSQVVSEHDGAGNLLSEYIYSGSRMIAKSVSGAMQYFLSDRLSTRVILDTTGNIAGRMAHLPFGDDFAATGSQEKHHLTSYERDGDSGNDYAVNRWHAHGVGRFLQADPYRASGYMQIAQSWNRYSYTRNDPTNRIDRVGREDQPYNAGSLGTSTVSAGLKEGFSDISGQFMVEQEPPNPGTVPVPPLPPPPLPRPTVPQNSNRNFVRALNRAFENLDERLRSRPACAALFGGIDNAQRILSGTEYRFVDLGGPRQNPDGTFSVFGAQTIDDAHVQVNSSGPFMNQNLLVITPSGPQSRTFDFGTGLRDADFQALLILHELGHQSGVFQDDRGDSELNRRQTQQVLDACF